MFKKILFSLVLMAMGFASSFAQETLTVYDGTANSTYVPVYGLWADSYLKAEFVMNSEDLSDMNGGTINGLTWYLSSPAATSWGAANFQIFMMEVNDPTISAFYGMTNATLVYEGALDGTQAEMAIEFATPYLYQGGHLLIGVYNTVPGTYKGAAFAGMNVTGASVSGYSSSSLDAITPTARDFLPKTTFNYMPAGGVVYYKPTNLQATDLTPNSATITWTPGADETSWNVEYKLSGDEEWIPAGSVSTPEIELDVLENATSYDVRVQADYGEGNLSGWATMTFTTPVCDADDMGEVTLHLTDTYGDGWNGNKLQIVYHRTGAVIQEFTLPSSTSEGTFTINLCYGENYDLIWVAGTYGYETGFTVTAPDGSTIYEFQGTGSSSGGSPTAGVLTTFQISPNTCPRPTELTASNIVYNGATLTWTPGTEEQDTWQVVYGTGDVDPNALEPVTVNEPTAQLTGLEENTTYSAYVRSVCTEEDMSTWSDVCTFTTPLQFPIPAELAVDNITTKSAQATWTGEAETYNLRYRTPGGYEKLFEEDFEGNVAWIPIDADGDGNDWGLIKISQYSMGGVPLQAKDGDYCLMSASYISGAVTPDNWVISPQTTLNGTLEFWVADDGTYPEIFRVYASTTGTDIADFEPLTDDIQTSQLGSPNQWVKYEIDLSAFEGQQGYIAFRHYGTEDQDIILLDAISINGDEIEPGNWIEMEGVTSPATMQPLTPNTTYEVQVQAVYADGNSEWTDLVEFTTLPADAMPINLEVTETTGSTADVDWNGYQETYNLRYRVAGSSTVKLFESFEDGFGDWTLVDADGDGYNWTQFNPQNFTSGGFPAYDGTYGAMSRSWQSDPLTPDNWLISPQIELGSTLQYYIVDDGSDYQETYRIYISTTDNNIESFEPLTDDMLSPNSTTWTLETIDLSAYEGQTGYIAFRQYNCTDRDFMIIDAITILGNEVAPGEWIDVEGVEAPYQITGLTPETTYEVEVQGIVDENTVTEWTAPVQFTTTEQTTVRGDVNGVGGVDMDDLTALINYLLDPVNNPINEPNAAICDSLDSNLVDMDDLTALINYLLNGEWPN